MMRRFSLVAASAIALAAAGALGAGISAAGVVSTSGTAAAQDSEGNDGPDTPLTGTDLERATRAALERTGGGTVTETEVGDDGAAYSVEIRTSDGKNVEVQLNDAFEVIGQEVDD